MLWLAIVFGWTPSAATVTAWMPALVCLVGAGVTLKGRRDETRSKTAAETAAAQANNAAERTKAKARDSEMALRTMQQLLDSERREKQAMIDQYQEEVGSYRAELISVRNAYRSCEGRCDEVLTLNRQLQDRIADLERHTEGPS